MKRIHLLTICLFSLFYSLTTLAMNEDGRDHSLSPTISIYPQSSVEELNNLVVPSAMEDIDYLSINKEKRQITLFRIDQDPLELEKTLQPSLPWDVPQAQFEQFMSAHFFHLKQLNDGAYKVDLHASLLGGGKVAGKMLWKFFGSFKLNFSKISACS